MSNKFPDDFSADRTSYNRSVEAWNDLLKSILSKNDQTVCWEAWFPLVDFDSPGGIDGSPICSFINHKEFKGVMICGLANNDRIDFSAYMKVYGEKALGHDPIDTLMLHVANRQIVTATPLIEKWVSGKYTPEEMKIWIE